MVWVRLDDHFDEHPKFAKAGPLGMALWVAGLAYCNRTATDGYIPWSVARTLISWEFLGPLEERGRKHWTIRVKSGLHTEEVSPEFVVGLLVEAGLWDGTADGGYVVHDYAKYQPTREQAAEERAQKRAAGQAGGQASAQARARAPAQAPSQAESKQTLKQNSSRRSSRIQPRSRSRRRGAFGP